MEIREYKKQPIQQFYVNTDPNVPPVAIPAYANPNIAPTYGVAAVASRPVAPQYPYNSNPPPPSYN